MYIGLALSSFVFWPLSLLHGRRPYILVAFAITLPLQFPQAIMVMTFRSPDSDVYRRVLLFCRFFTGFFLGLANINFFTVLLDLFGASLQSAFPHQELVVGEDPRRDGGGMGIWLGIWTWCWIGSIAIGFGCGASIIYNLNPEWGFYIVAILIAVLLFINIITPETRRSHYRRSSKKILDEKTHLKKLIGRGEVKLHMSSDSPK
jgi:MFS family permease